MNQYNHIEGLKGREPVGAVVTIGRKGWKEGERKGAPVENDRFFFVSPFENEQGIRPQLPRFSTFNEADPSHRQQIMGGFVHHRIEDAFEFYLRAQVLGGKHPTPPRRRPGCQGDGIKATRYFGEVDTSTETTATANSCLPKDPTPRTEEDWREIDCPNELCEFRQGDAKRCKPMARLYFMPYWDRGKLPNPVTKWTSRSWFSVSNLVGFFDHIRAQASGLGMGDFSIYGLTFTLTLGRKTNPKLKRSFPVVSISPNISLVEFFMNQRQMVEAAGGTLQLGEGVRSETEQSEDVVDADFDAITPGVPGAQAAMFEEG